IGSWLRSDTPCDSNDVMPRHSRLVDELAADAAAGSKDRDAHRHLSRIADTGEPIVTICRSFLPTIWLRRSGHPPHNGLSTKRLPRGTRVLCTTIRLLCRRDAHRLERRPGTWTMEEFTRQPFTQPSAARYPVQQLVQAPQALVAHS